MKQTIVFVFICFAVFFHGNIVAQTNENYQLSTHILDISKGKPAGGVSIELFKFNTESREFEKVDTGRTDENGRIGNFLSSGNDNSGTYKLKFETLPYFTGQGMESIYPYIEVVFQISGKGHYHIPITVSANGYSTYRGS